MATQLIEQHHGESAEADPEHIPDFLTHPHRTRETGSDDQQLKASTIMMVDDEPFMMDVVQAYLEEAGYQNFITLSNATRALPMIAELAPDILLLDLVMPEINGLEILAALRAETRFKHLPVIVLTSSSDSETKLKALELGATDFLSKPVDASELILRLRNTLEAKAYQDQLAYYDDLTGMPNRSMFRERVRWMLEAARRNGEPLAVIHIGIDRFKEVNESFGPGAGDELLQRLGTALQHSVRSSDLLTRFGTDENHKNLARIGGDEFGVLLSNLATVEDAASIARRIQEALGGSYRLGEREVYVTTSLGIACFPDDGIDHETLLQHATGAMHQAKLDGTNALRFYSSEINAKSADRLLLENDLRKGIKLNELVVLYQPKVEVQTGRIVGAEALVRWEHSVRGLMLPHEFIEIAERSQLIVELGRWVLERACWQLSEWQQAGLGDTSIAVNVSSLQLRDAGLPAEIERLINVTGIDPAALVVEITESAIIDGDAHAIGMLNALKALGIKLSMDDFGTGYSSLSYLKRFPLDELKIDRSFITDIGNNPEDESLVSAIISMSHSLGLEVCAEGVETAAQLAFLAREGCERFQGYICSKPVVATTFTDLLIETTPRRR